MRKSKVKNKKTIDFTTKKYYNYNVNKKISQKKRQEKNLKKLKKLLTINLIYDIIYM